MKKNTTSLGVLVITAIAVVVFFSAYFLRDTSKPTIIEPEATSKISQAENNNTENTEPVKRVNSEPENQYTWKVYRNAKWGIEFEYPDEIYRTDMEIDYDQPLYNNQPYRGKMLAVHMQRGGSDVQYKIRIFNIRNPEILAGGHKADELGIVPREMKKIGGNTWRIFDGGFCTSEEVWENKGLCPELEKMPRMTYSLEANGHWYQVIATDPADEHTETFQRIVKSIKIFPPKQ